ncbi:cysteine proteinase [Sodiomyces alkalinus F11]|uniref:ubiquitinyl hydrolase 1 n=1 Tax=Sodiomyces alkalinus (strain CBS 110278 / VKM F-3762 / F11) TaxID=1314773 RepID=A0A3N2Q2R6_SODAK|nr:cysteine proteinase [Sodiomyces alkalinus F11]ROT41061.1 cysteine proteinase [Sodiomyces alkalinus F11]
MTGDPSSEPAVQDEVAAQHCAAERYEPVLEGPLVGHKLSSDVITAEYAKADPVYVEKTVTYSHFRPIQGDGNCGWRAIAFSYFEHLVLASDPDKLLQEIARLTSLNNYISNVGGYDFTLFEDMVQETVTLLKEVAQLSGEPLAAMDHLLKRFNDPECANGIIYHMRLLAGSWLKGNVAEYEPFFVGDGGLHHWCHVNIESPNREIDHVGITLLTAILLKPAGFVLEIAYLDRTPGTQANVYRFPEEATGQDADNLGPIIYLLFRPDHYDILYKALPEEVPLSRTAGAVPVSDPSPPPGAGNLQVNLVTFAHQHHQIISAPPSLRDFSIVDYTELARLPGSGGPPSVISSSVAAPAAPSPMHNAFSVSPQSPWLMDPFPESGIPQAIASQPQPLPPAVSTQALPHPPPQPLAPAAQANPTKTGQTVDYQLRFSSQCFHLKNSPVERSLLSQNSFPEPGFTTTMFKNSHFNKAHYNNPQFHPEQWTPDD